MRFFNMIFVKRFESLSDEEKERLFKRSISLDSAIPKAREIIQKVRENGDSALYELTKEFDGVSIESIRVEDDEFEEAHKKVDDKNLKALEGAIERIERFHAMQLPSSWMKEVEQGIELGLLFTPIESVGVYVPGGRACYPSTLLMCCIPAKIAGVERICVCSPPQSDGSVNPYILVASELVGVGEVYRVGGAQAISAMAYGTESIPSVKKIVGPGNIWVTAAKMLVKGVVDIDSPAGPSEVLIIADENANVDYVAWDMLAQAEHDPHAISILLTDSVSLAEAVRKRIVELLQGQPRKSIMMESLANSMILVVQSIEKCIEVANEFAPEHLEIMTENPEDILNRVKNAGSVFLGEYTPVAVGDYASGTNHVLPTGGWAKVYSALSTMDFLKISCVQHLNEEGLLRIHEIVCTLAELEGLYAHAESVRARMNRTDNQMGKSNQEK